MKAPRGKRAKKRAWSADMSTPTVPAKNAPALRS
jgi:hypothetical protein